MENTMKTIGKVILTILIVVYAIIAILLTVCLFNLNTRGVAEFELSSVISVEENYSNEIKEGDLIIVSKQSRGKSDVKIGDGIFYYDTEANDRVEYGVVSNILEDGGSDTYIVGKDYNVYFTNFIGNRIKKLGHIGKVYNVLMSQFGYLGLVILPTLIAVVVEIYAVIMEIINIKNEIKQESLAAVQVTNNETKE